MCLLDIRLIGNPYTWLQNHSLVFIENPVGTGYSFTDHKDGYVNDMATVSEIFFKTTGEVTEYFNRSKTYDTK